MCPFLKRFSSAAHMDHCLPSFKSFLKYLLREAFPKTLINIAAYSTLPLLPRFIFLRVLRQQPTLLHAHILFQCLPLPTMAKAPEGRNFVFAFFFFLLIFLLCTEQYLALSRYLIMIC